MRGVSAGDWPIRRKYSRRGRGCQLRMRNSGLDGTDRPANTPIARMIILGYNGGTNPRRTRAVRRQVRRLDLVYPRQPAKEMLMSVKVIGVDLGGTQIRASRANDAGLLESRSATLTPAASSEPSAFTPMASFM